MNPTRCAVCDKPMGQIPRGTTGLCSTPCRDLYFTRMGWPIPPPLPTTATPKDKP